MSEKKRVVLKVGSAVLTEQNRIAKDRMNNLVAFIAELMELYEVILVSSGAVAAGYTYLKINKKVVANKQALASVGQPILMINYGKKFEKLGINIAQVLLTADDFDSRKRTRFAQDAVEALIANRVLPIINENDVTATQELVFGDNDQLSAYVTKYFDAHILVILTDIDGYYNSNPKENPDAKLIKIVPFISDSELNQNPSSNNEFATGGIVTKLKSANFLMKYNIPTFLSSGFDLTFVRDYLVLGKHTRGTLFMNQFNI